MGVAIFPPHVIHTTDGPTGFDIELWEAIGRDLGVEWNYRQMEFTRLMDAVRQGSVDLAVAGISLTYRREVEMDFSVPYMDAGLKILSHRDSSTTFERLAAAIGTRSVLLPLATVIGFIALCSLFFYLAERGGPVVDRRIFPGIFQASWCALATATTVGYGDVVPRTWLGRFLCFVVMLIGIALFGIAIAELSAGLTVEHLESSISSLDDLSGRSVATVAGTTSEDLARRHTRDVRTTRGVEEAWQLLVSREVDAILFDAAPLMHYSQQHPEQDVVLAGWAIESEQYAFAFPEGSHLRERVNRALLGLIESGRYDAIYTRWFGSPQ